MKRIILIIITVIVIASLRIIYSPVETLQEPITAREVTLKEASVLFPDAHSVKRVDGSSRHEVVNAGGETIGHLVHSSPERDHITGYAGPTPLIIAIDKEGKVSGIHLLRSEETPSFIETIKDEGLLDEWKGLKWEKASYIKVDAVTGATLTSRSIIRTVKHTLLDLSKEEPLLAVKLTAGDLAAVILALLAFIACVFPVKHRNVIRTILLVVSFVYLGLWRGELLSMQLVSTWIKKGVVLTPSIVLLFIAVLTVIVSLFTGKALYCYYICPFGAVQEFIGKLSPWRREISSPLSKVLGKVRVVLLIIIAILLLLRVPVNLTNF